MRLVDCFIQIFVYVAYLLKSGEQAPPYEQVRGDIQRLIRESERCVESGAVPRADYDAARFAVFAWVDEAVMSSAWAGKTQWQRDLLQRQYYQTTDAGERFFDRLNAVGLHQRDVREVYYLCLALGFTGRYSLEGDSIMLAGLKSENLKILTGVRSTGSVPEKQELFPGAYPDESEIFSPGGSKKRFSSLVLLGAVAPVTLYVALFVIYRFVLSSIGQAFIRTLP